MRASDSQPATQWSLHLQRGQSAYHQIGATVPNTSDWQVDPSSSQCANNACSNKFLTYGPYVDLGLTDPYWQYVATFKLLTDQLPAGNTNVLATIDVMIWNGS